MCFYLEFCEYFVFWLQTVVAVTIVDSNLSPICLLVLPNTLPVAATCSWFPVSDALSTINCTSVVNHNIVKHTEAVEKKTVIVDRKFQTPIEINSVITVHLRRPWRHISNGRLAYLHFWYATPSINAILNKCFVVRKQPTHKWENGF